MNIHFYPVHRFSSQKAYAEFAKKRYDKGQYLNDVTPYIPANQKDRFSKRSASVTFGMQTPTTLSASEKLAQMAQQLSKHQLHAYFIPPEDEHLNEYLPDNKKRIEWLTGFTGESAPLLITPQKMMLYADGRFHLQVDMEVDAQTVEAYKLGSDESASRAMAKHLETMASKNPNKPLVVGYDPFIVSPQRLDALQKAIPAPLQIQWKAVSGNLTDTIWMQRPSLPTEKALYLDKAVTGQTVSEKLKSIREKMTAQGVTVLPMTKLDDIAWLFNIRGRDIPYNPLVESYGLLTLEKAYWFVPAEKVSPEIQSVLAAQGVEIQPYAAYVNTLQGVLSSKPKVLIDKGAITMGTLDLVNASGATLLEAESPIILEKALKNPTEIEKMQLANFRASRAIIRHLAATEKRFFAGEKLSEVTLREDLESKYQEEPEFYDLSFPTIPGLGTNSAIIHYTHADANKVAQAGEFYLLDSGCQYVGGTTDTTRTTIMGEPSDLQKHRYTAVLKAHIACANMRFPEGTKGLQIDAVCRDKLWQAGLDFGHGTGHGVGAFLNVHEGPNRIAKTGTVAFQPGMITSIEPGYYEKDWGGIRLENLYTVVVDSSKPAFEGKAWLKFEPLTWVPFEKRLIDFAALNPEERAWLKKYYDQILEKLSPTLSAEENAWLQKQCRI